MRKWVVLAGALFIVLAAAAGLVYVLDGQSRLSIVLSAAAGLVLIGALVGSFVVMAGRLNDHARLLTEIRGHSAKSREHIWRLRRELLPLVSAVHKETRDLRERSLETSAIVKKSANRTVDINRVPVIRDISALLSLHSTVHPVGEFQPRSNWSATPETILFMVTEVTSGRARTVLEIGSGLSTVWLGLAAKNAPGQARIVSLEHDPEFAAQTVDALERNGLGDYVDVRLAPLGQVEVDGQSFSWYSEAALSELHEVDLVFVDGPPRATGHFARYPAFPLVQRALSSTALVVLDDTNRSDERAIVTSWLASDLGSVTVERELDRSTVLRYVAR